MRRARIAVLAVSAAVALVAAPGSSTPAAGNPVSHAFSFGNAKLNKRAGTATLPVNVAGAGLVSLAPGEGVRGSQARAALKARVLLAVRPRGDAKERLADRGQVTVRVRVTFAPDGGSPATQELTVTLKKSLKKR